VIAGKSTPPTKVCTAVVAATVIVNELVTVRVVPLTVATSTVKVSGGGAGPNLTET
jgi:hypothetical protein